MEGMAKGWDGSRHCTACGHDFISVSIVGPGFEDAVPVYVKIARGRKSKGDLLDEAIEAVKKVVGENGWFAVDRGMDSVEFIFFMDECGNKKKVLVVGFRVSAEGPDGSDGKSRPVLDPPENIFRPMFSGVS